MTRSMTAALIALAFLADTTAAGAQVRIRRDGVPAVSGGGRIQGAPSAQSTADRAENPPTGSRSTARIAFVPRVLVPQAHFPLQMGLGWASFGYIPVWSVSGGTIPTVFVPLPEGAPMGGVQLDIEPRRAQVYVDGAHVGIVSDFSGYYQHLELVAGSHLVTIVAPSYEALTIQVMVSPGYTVTYRGTLTRAH